MKYDLRRLKQAVDEQIPEIRPDEALLDRAMKRVRPPYGLYASRALTAFAACAVLLFVLGSIFAPGAQVKPDDVGDGRHLLSQGSTAEPKPTNAPDSAEHLSVEEDLSAYQPYSPLYAASALPEEAVFGNVVIRKEEHSYEKVFVFYDRETEEAIFTVNENVKFHWQGFAYFPLTDTALVGNGDGMALIGREGLLTGYGYSHFDYVGGGVAIAANHDADESEPDPMYLVSTKDGEKLSRDYAIIGAMRSGDVRLLMGHDNQDLLGDFDVLSMDGRVITRVGELQGAYLGKWLAVKLPGEEDYCLIDMQGNVQLNGMRFSRVAFEKDGMLVVWTDEGCGVLDSDGNWVFEPGEYAMIETIRDGLFNVVDAQTGQVRQINAQGEDVDTWHFRFSQAVDKIGEAYRDWRERMGEAGYFAACLLCMWLYIRLNWACRQGKAAHMLVNELGFAAYIAGVLIISHRYSLDYVTIFPTDTSTKGAEALAGWWIAASLAMTASLIAAYPKLRTQKKAFLAGYAVMLLPWAWKAFCGDVSVMGWRAFSNVVFGGGLLLAVLLRWVKPVKRFMEWCARFDDLNEYGRWVRIGWWAVLLAALINFGAGCFISGQEMVKCTHRVECERGVTDELNEEWFDAVNWVSGLYRESGYDEETLEALGGEEQLDYSVITAVRWLHENELDMLTGNMVYTVRMTGEVEMKRPADVQLILEMEENASDGVWQIVMEAPLAEKDGSIRAETVILAVPGEPLPNIEAWLHIRQRGNVDSIIAAQYFYRAELGTVLQDDYAAD